MLLAIRASSSYLGFILTTIMLSQAEVVEEVGALGLEKSGSDLDSDAD